MNLVENIVAIYKMKSSINGIKYYFKILVENDTEEYCFSIKAVSKENNRTSRITNLNAILSELNIDVADKKSEESIWMVRKKESESLVRITRNLLLNREFVKYLEKNLDEDREQGEWENQNYKKRLL